jgi:hypothetical protein
MPVQEEVSGIIAMMGKIRQTPLFQLISYLEEKKPEDRQFARLRKEQPEMLNTIESLEYLITHELVWIEVDGTVRPGKLADSLYAVVSKTNQWEKKE